MTGKGINANYITSGQLDTSLIRIMAGSFPSFRWDSVGLSAYEFELNEDNKTGKNFNYSKFVRFDQYGLYGINGYANFNPLIAENGLSGEDKIWDKAYFALTWKGFSLKNDDGSVKITSDNDIQVFAEDQERIRIGRFGDKTYGIRISDSQGAPVMLTKDDGTLWLENALYIGANSKTAENATVKIGYLEATRAKTDIHEVIHAGNDKQDFIVYEDGTMKATAGEFTGTIHATGGQIGNLTIGEIEESGYTVKIEAESGYIFKNSKDEETKILTAYLYKGSSLVEGTLEYQWYKNGTKLSEGTFQTYEVEAGDFEEVETYSCVITI